jgi:HEAT repeat protein
VLRDALFLAEFGAEALPYAYIGVAVAAAAFVWLESMVAHRFTRGGATRFNQYLAIGFSAFVAVILPSERHWTIAAFYIWTGSQAMMLLPHFWALALDVWDSRRARSIFPVFSGCALLGGLTGGAFAAWSTSKLAYSDLMWTLPGLLTVSYLLSHLVERSRSHHPAPAKQPASASRWGSILRSRYIQILAIALAMSVVVSTLVDFQFKMFIQSIYQDQHSLTQFLGKFYVGLNVLSLLFQFSVAGLALRWLGLGTATALQPATAVMFASAIIGNPALWVIVALRWAQGIVFQTVGKASSEIYYSAVHPRERTRIKPAIDTLVERWSDAAVGVLLIGVLHTVGVQTSVVAIITIAFAVVWLALIFVLNRQYGRAFGQALSTRWVETETTTNAVRTTSVRESLLQALRADDERQIVFALTLCQSAEDLNVAGAVRACLRHPSTAVRTAAVEAMRAMQLADTEGLIPGLLEGQDESLRRAAVSYLLAKSPDATTFARRLLEGRDEALRRYMADALFERPYEAPDAIASDWIDAQLESGSRENLLLAARAAGAMRGNVSVRPLRTLLANPDIEVKRVALISARRRPYPDLIDAVLPLFTVPEVSREAREAASAIGDPVIPHLESLLGGVEGPGAQAHAARTLGRIASSRARKELMKLARSGEPRLRHFGLEGMSRIRADRGEPVIPRATAHKLFLRELADYRANRVAARGIVSHREPEVRLFAASLDESAEWALERGTRALACWYEAKPLAGAFERLRSREPQAEALAMEYLNQVLPRGVFKPVSRIFEEKSTNQEDGSETERDEVAESIRAAWRWGDAWLRACAVRAARFAPSLDRTLFETGGNQDPLVKEELAALGALVSTSTQGAPC